MINLLRFMWRIGIGSLWFMTNQVKCQWKILYVWWLAIFDYGFFSSQHNIFGLQAFLFLNTVDFCFVISFLRRNSQIRFGPNTTYTICLFCIQTQFFRLRKNYRNVYNLTSGDIDAYTGGLAELPVEGGLVRFLFISFLWTSSGIYRTQEILSEKWLDALNTSL